MSELEICVHIGICLIYLTVGFVCGYSIRAVFNNSDKEGEE